MEAGPRSQVLYSTFRFVAAGGPEWHAPTWLVNPLIPLWFDSQPSSTLLRCNKMRRNFMTKDFTGELFVTR